MIDKNKITLMIMSAIYDAADNKLNKIIERAQAEFKKSGLLNIKATIENNGNKRTIKFSNMPPDQIDLANAIIKKATEDK